MDTLEKPFGRDRRHDPHPGGAFPHRARTAQYPEEAPAHVLRHRRRLLWIDATPSPTPNSAHSSRRPATSTWAEDPAHLAGEFPRQNLKATARAYLAARAIAPPRHAEPVDTLTSHVGFRCILRGEGLGDG